MSHVPEIRERKKTQAVEKSTYRDLAAKNPNFTESVYSTLVNLPPHVYNCIQLTC